MWKTIARSSAVAWILPFAASFDLQTDRKIPINREKPNPLKRRIIWFGVSEHVALQRMERVKGRSGSRLIGNHSRSANQRIRHKKIIGRVKTWLTKRRHVLHTKDIIGRLQTRLIDRRHDRHSQDLKTWLTHGRHDWHMNGMLDNLMTWPRNWWHD